MIFVTGIKFSGHFKDMNELLGSEESGLEDIELDRIQNVGHSNIQARGTATYEGDEYSLTLTDTGESLKVRVSSEDEVYMTNLDESLDRDNLRYSFEDIMLETELDLAYSSNQTTV